MGSNFIRCSFVLSGRTNEINKLGPNSLNALYPHVYDDGICLKHTRLRMNGK